MVSLSYSVVSVYNTTRCVAGAAGAATAGRETNFKKAPREPTLQLLEAFVCGTGEPEEEGLERWRERNGRMIEGLGGEGREIQKEVKGLERAGDPLHRGYSEGRCGEGVGARRVAEWGPSRAQAGPDRATKGRFLPLTSLLKVPSGFLAARWCASSPTSTS